MSTSIVITWNGNSFNAVIPPQQRFESITVKHFSIYDPVAPQIYPILHLGSNTARLSSDTYYGTNSSYDLLGSCQLHQYPANTTMVNYVSFFGNDPTRLAGGRQRSLRNLNLSVLDGFGNLANLSMNAVVSCVLILD